MNEGICCIIVGDSIRQDYVVFIKIAFKLIRNYQIGANK